MVPKAEKTKRLLSVDTDIEGFVDDERQPSLLVMVATMGAMLADLTNLMTRLEVWEKKRCIRSGDIDLGYISDHEINSSSRQPQLTAAPITCSQAPGSTSNFRLPVASSALPR